jgi:hypothetical protein
LDALDFTKDPYISNRPIITSDIVEGHVTQGGVIKTKSGSIYVLESPLPESNDCEFARGLLIERANQYFEMQGWALNFDHFKKLNSIIDRIIAGEKT